MGTSKKFNRYILEEKTRSSIILEEQYYGETCQVLSKSEAKLLFIFSLKYFSDCALCHIFEIYHFFTFQNDVFKNVKKFFEFGVDPCRYVLRNWIIKKRNYYLYISRKLYISPRAYLEYSSCHSVNKGN